VVPETFSFTLQELFELGIPTLASDLGSLHDRIEDGVSGFLCPPEPVAMLSRLRQLAADRNQLDKVHRNLRSRTAVRGLPDMLADYRDLLQAPEVSAKAYFSKSSRFPSEPIVVGQCDLRWDGGLARSAPFRPSSARQKITLSWPEQSGRLTNLEMHPIGDPGRVRLFAARLLDSAEKPVWSWDGSASAFSSTSKIAAAKDSVILHFTGSDTGIRLPISLEQMNRLSLGGRLELEMEWSPAATPAVETRSEFIKLKSSAPREQLELELEAARLRIASIEASHSWKLSKPLRTLGTAYLTAMKSFRKHR